MLLNNYQYLSPIKRFWEDLMWFIRFGVNYIRNGFKTKTILFYPEYTNKRTVLSKILKENGWNITNNQRISHQITIAWENKTFRKEPDLELKSVLNAGLTDISKEKVNALHEKVFGYGFHVNPTTHSGKMVAKSDENAQHDGKLMDGPIEKVEKGVVYQIVIDNTVNNAEVMDLRCPVFGSSIPFVYKKYRPIADRFSNTNTRAELVKTERVLSTLEKENIIAFCKTIGADYAELDVLRNKKDGRIYIVDVNPTPWGPPNHLPQAQVNTAKEKLYQAFFELTH